MLTPLILAIEPDGRQASLITTLAQGSLGAELIMTSSAAAAIKALRGRVPDLILTSSLLSPGDEAALTDRLKELDAAGTHVQTLVIPQLAEASSEPPQQTGLLKRLGWRKTKGATPDGCDPAVFGAQIAEYLKRANRANINRVFAHLPQSTLPGKPPAGARDEPAPLDIFDAEPREASTGPAEPVAPLEAVFEPVLESILADSMTVEAEPVSIFNEPQWSGPLVDDLHAIRAELDAMFAAPIDLESTAPDPIDSDPIDSNPIDSDQAMTSTDEPAHELEPAFEPALNASAEPETIVEPETPEPVPAIRRDLVEMLTAIRHDIEPLRSTPGHRTLSAGKARTVAVQDEWGFFDPQQCGMAALLARLEQIAQQKDLAAAEPD